MVELQIISKILEDKNTSILTMNGITEEYFTTYGEEFKFISNHEMTYGKVPDKETFLAKFPDLTILHVTEPESYLVQTFHEEYLYSITVPILNKLSDIMQVDAQEAVSYLQSQLPLLSGQTGSQGVDIVSRSNVRLEDWKDRRNDSEGFYIPTGFPELDEITGGWQCGEELAVIFARTGQGKSWVLIKMLEHAWRCGKRVGLIEPEMSATKTGYRFDTIAGNISNTALNRGQEIENYEDYITKLGKRDTPFFVASPKDFKRNITVSKLRAFVQANELDILGIDGISYLRDERSQRGDNKTTMLTNISEDLMDLSIELKIPILIVGQANRDGVRENEAPGLENIRDSDGIAYNSSVVIAVRQAESGLELAVRKNRNGRTGDTLNYYWDIDTGVFEYSGSGESSQQETNSYVSTAYNDSHDDVF